MTSAARLIIWAFFLLIATKLLEFFAVVHDSRIHPSHVYAILICAGIAVVVANVWTRGFPSLQKGELAFFGITLALALLILASPGGHQDYYFGKTAPWPLINLLMGACLFYFVAYMDLAETVRGAAIGALVIQLGGILIDLWFPGTFAEWAPRPAGLPQNSNNGALLICLLLTFLLPTKLGQQPGRAILYAMAASAPMIFATLSTSGKIYFVTVAAFAGWSAYSKRKQFGPADVVVASCLLALMTSAVVMSPDAQRSDTAAIWHSRIGIAPSDYVSLGYSTSKGQQAEIDKSMKDSDDTSSQRWKALTFFLGEAIKRPLFGFGTGYSYAFTRGPHNSLAALFVEDGILAPLLYSVGLLLLGIIALRRRAVSLMALVTVGSMNAMLSHTQVIEPWFAVFAFAALGSSLSSMSAMSDHAAVTAD